jgi:hypothetical protein
LDIESSNQTEHFVVENNQKGIKSIFDYLQKKKINPITTFLSFESSGLQFSLNVFLSEKKPDYWVVPAIEIMRSKRISRGKNDRDDPKYIAFYSLRNIDKLNLSYVPEKNSAIKITLQRKRKICKSNTSV